MGTRLTQGPVEDPNQLALIADKWTVPGGDFTAAFREACWLDAQAHKGDVHPSRVSRILADLYGDFDPRRFSAAWAPATSLDGFLINTGTYAPIDGTVSRGNSNKRVQIRCWAFGAPRHAPTTTRRGPA